ncbi:MAG: hypothetical protein ACM3JJ_08450 [Hyphomicrobiales bacterium]
MSPDLFLLASGGLAALFAAAVIAFLGPGRYVAAVAGVCMAAFGLLQFGFARAVFERNAWGVMAWFDRSLALALPVSALWILLSIALGRGDRVVARGAWRLYLALQAALSLAALLAVTLGEARVTPGLAEGAKNFPLSGLDRAILCGILLNLVLVSANFEATHLSLPRRYRRAFRPALGAVLVTSGAFTYLFASSLISGHVDSGDLALGSVPITLLSLLLPLSMIRGRVGEAHLVRGRIPITSTNSLLVAVAFLIGTAGILWLTRALGLSFGKGLFVLATGGLAIGIGAVAVSNRLRRRLQRLLDPIWYDPGASRGAIAARAVAPVERSRALDEACSMIPGNARDLAGLEPITLFLTSRDSDAYRPVASTIEPRPDVSVLAEDPLAVELRRARRPVRLRGRTDDLEYVSIYVENAEQIRACRAACAIPLPGEEDLIGFLLCGPERGTGTLGKDSLALLHAASRRYAAILERLAGGKDRGVNK